MRSLKPGCNEFSESMATKYFESENLVIISSNNEIDMTQWRKYISEKWNEVRF